LALSPAFHPIFSISPVAYGLMAIGHVKGKDIRRAAHSLFAGNLSPLGEWHWSSRDGGQLNDGG